MNTTIEKRKIKRPGAGKTKGATSYVEVSIEDLKRFFGPGTKLHVRRSQLEKLGIVKIVKPRGRNAGDRYPRAVVRE